MKLSDVERALLKRACEAFGVEYREHRHCISQLMGRIAEQGLTAGSWYVNKHGTDLEKWAYGVALDEWARLMPKAWRAEDESVKRDMLTALARAERARKLEPRFTRELHDAMLAKYPRATQVEAAAELDCDVKTYRTTCRKLGIEPVRRNRK